jgi:hypothetical protein
MKVRAPRLLVTGGSVAGPVLGGVFYVEGGYRHAADDPDGTDPLVPNSGVEGFSGYSRGLWQDGVIGVQASLQTVLHELGPGERRHDLMLTARFAQQLLGQTLELGGFVAWGVSRRDGYALLSARYRYNDALSLDVGSNLFFGGDRASRFGALVENSNVFTSIRYGF